MDIDERFIRGDKISDLAKFLQRQEVSRAARTIAPFLPFNNMGSYTVAYVDFFDKKIAERNGDWRAVVEDYLYATEAPVINDLAGGRGCLLAR